MHRKPLKLPAKHYLFYCLGRRDHSILEIRTKMQNRGYDEMQINEAIEYAKRAGYIDEARFATNFIKNKKQFGPKALQFKLKSVGIAPNLNNSEIDFNERARLVFHNKVKSLKIRDLKAKQKIYRFMLSRGFELKHFKDLLDTEFTN